MRNPTVTVRRDACKRWWVCFGVEAPGGALRWALAEAGENWEGPPAPEDGNAVVGLDVGVRNWIVDSNGNRLESPLQTREREAKERRRRNGHHGRGRARKKGAVLGKCAKRTAQRRAKQRRLAPQCAVRRTGGSSARSEHGRAQAAEPVTTATRTPPSTSPTTPSPHGALKQKTPGKRVPRGRMWLGKRRRLTPPERPQSDTSVAGVRNQALRHGAHRLEAGTNGVLTRAVGNRVGEDARRGRNQSRAYTAQGARLPSPDPDRDQRIPPHEDRPGRVRTPPQGSLDQTERPNRATRRVDR